MKDYYKLLELHKDATQQQIKTAYRRLALKYHPDVNKHTEAHEKFVEINEAYEILSDVEKRKVYDELFSNASASPNSVTKAQSAYNHWQEEARDKADGYSRMSIKDFQYKVLNVLVKTYDTTKFMLKILLPILLVWYLFGGHTCR